MFDAVVRLVVSVLRDEALARICTESDEEADVRRLLVPVIAESTEEIGLVKVSAKSLPTVPGVAKVEVATLHTSAAEILLSAATNVRRD